MNIMHNTLGLAKLSTEEVESNCVLLAEGFCEYCGISTGIRTLFWDALVAIIEAYNGLEFDNAIDQATKFVAQIDPQCNEYDTSMAYGNWYYIFRNLIHEECHGRYDEAINIGMRAMKYPIWKLYLDDIRNPSDNSYVLARSVEEAKSLIEAYGIPLYISFDHDMGEDADGKLCSTGYDLAKWLVEQDMNKKSGIHIFSVFDFEVHSMNPVGAENIRSFLKAYLKHKDKEGNWYGN